MSAKPLNILQFGETGQLAREMRRAAAKHSDIAATTIPREVADFSRPDEVVQTMRRAAGIDIVVNTTAYTHVDRAECEEALAKQINAESVGLLAEICAKRRIPLIHISTGFVFDGTKCGSYLETDATSPLNAYGRTKLAGERLIREVTGLHVIIRTSWLYSSHGTNFVKTMLRLGAEREELRVVDDQFGAPTSAADLANAVLTIARMLNTGTSEKYCGTFHYSGAGETTWCRFAQTIFTQAARWKTLKARIVPIEMSEYPAPARRPRNSMLDCAKVERVFGIQTVPWTAAVDQVLCQLESTESGSAA